MPYVELGLTSRIGFFNLDGICLYNWKDHIYEVYRCLLPIPKYFLKVSIKVK